MKDELLSVWNRALFYVSSLYSGRLPNKPGAAIEKLSDEERQHLSELKSEDLGPDKFRDEDVYGDDEFYRQKQFQQDRLNFDKKLRKC